MTVLLLILLMFSPVGVFYSVYRLYRLQKDVDAIKANVTAVMDCSSTMANNVNTFISDTKKGMDVIEVP